MVSDFGGRLRFYVGYNFFQNKCNNYIDAHTDLCHITLEQKEKQQMFNNQDAAAMHDQHLNRHPDNPSNERDFEYNYGHLTDFPFIGANIVHDHEDVCEAFADVLDAVHEAGEADKIAQVLANLTGIGVKVSYGETMYPDEWSIDAEHIFNPKKVTKHD